MIKRFALLLALCATSLSGSTQHRMFVGVEASVARDIFEGGAPDHFVIRGDASAAGGLTVGLEMSNRVWLQTGLLFKEYHLFVGPNNPQGILGMVTDVYGAWLVPLRLNTKHNLLREKIFVTTTLGYSVGLDANPGGWGRGGFGYIHYDEQHLPIDSIHIDFTMPRRRTTSFGLLQTGVGVEFLIKRTVPLALQVNYYTGLQRVSDIQVVYRIDDQPEQTALAYSKGSFWNVGLSLSYPISNIWKKTVEQ